MTDETADRGAVRERATPTTDGAEAEASRATGSTGSSELEQEGDIAADYLEELLDIADLDGDLDMDVEGDRAAVSIVGADLTQLVGARRRGARGAAGADPAGGLPRDRRAVAADAGHLRLPRREARGSWIELAEETVGEVQGVRRAGLAGRR